VAAEGRGPLMHAPRTMKHNRRFKRFGVDQGPLLPLTPPINAFTTLKLPSPLVPPRASNALTSEIA
jgi:hypothetical protein